MSAQSLSDANWLVPSLPRSQSTFSTQRQQLAYVVQRLESGSMSLPVRTSWVSTASRSPRTSVVFAATSSLPPGKTPSQATTRIDSGVPRMSVPVAAAAAAARDDTRRESVVRVTQPKELLLAPKNMVDQASTNDEVQSDGNLDLSRLLEYLDVMKKRGVRFIEATYVVNAWTLGGIIPLKHHGFILKTEDDDYLTLDFTRRGILWDTFDEYPELPDGTMYAKTHEVNVDPAHVKFYCQTTKPFSWPGNDCSHWARGLLQIMMVLEDPHGYHGTFPDMSKCNSVACSGAGGLNPLAVIGCFS